MTERKKLEWALVETSSREQRRLGDQLHDGLAQHLTGLALMASGLANAARLRGTAERRRLGSLGGFGERGHHYLPDDRARSLPTGDSRGALRAALRALVAPHGRVWWARRSL